MPRAQQPIDIITPRPRTWSVEDFTVATNSTFFIVSTSSRLEFGC
jgi:hypothetical protein